MTYQPTRAVSPRDLAVAAFWSLRHPLNEAMRRIHGDTFSLSALVAFAEELPPEVLHDYSEGGAEPVRHEIEGA